MTTQLDLFASLEPELRIAPVQPCGPVFSKAEVDELIVLRGRRVSLEIELAHDGERWMFSTSFCGPTGGYGYRVGLKWGRSTSSRDDALHFARKEIMERAASHGGFTEVPGLLEKLQ